jgi:hypothetical protein
MLMVKKLICIVMETDAKFKLWEGLNIKTLREFVVNTY